MSDFTPEEQTFAAAFADEHAPAETGAWESRPPRQARAGMPWQRTAAVIAAVAVVAAGLGTYFGLRGHVPSGSAVGTAGYPSPRTGAAMAYDAADGTVVMFGGVNSAGRALGDTWTWNGSAWAQQRPAHSPPASIGAAMAYDAANRSVLLFGGIQLQTSKGGVCSGHASISAGGPNVPAPSGAPSASAAPSALPRTAEPIPMPVPACRAPLASVGGDTWSWNGSDWRRVATGGPPGYISPILMATDPRTGEPFRVSFGGPMPACPELEGQAGTCHQPTFQAWIWNGDRWKAVLAPPTSGVGPFLGKPLALVTDPATHRLALWLVQVPAPACGLPREVPPAAAPKASAAAGGSAAAPLHCLEPSDVIQRQQAIELADWTGSGWSERTVKGAAPLASLYAYSSGFAPVYDGARNRIVFVGAGAAPGGDGTWTWDGSSFARVSSHTPSVFGAAIAYDASNGTLLLFGGTSVKSAGGGPALSSQTWTWDGSAWRLRGGLLVAQPTPRALMPVPATPSVVAPEGVGGGSSGGSSGCSVSWSEVPAGTGDTVDLTLTAGGPSPSCRATFRVVDASGTPVVIRGGPVDVLGTVHVSWSNWCASDTVYLEATSAADAAKGGDQAKISPPPCRDPKTASTWTAGPQAAPSTSRS
jgi:hypothetical protein